MASKEMLLGLLKEYKGSDESEENSRQQMIRFIEDNEDCFENTFKPGHITGSALVVDRDFQFTLLTHHSLIRKWFQFGGHSDGHSNPLEVGLREAEEESGLKSLQYLPNHEGIFDLDIHPISGNGKMPIHNHYDVRILLVADMNEPYVVSNESKDLKWVKLTEAGDYNSQPAFLRLVRKAIELNLDSANNRL